MRFDIDLEFSTTLPADEDHDSTVVTGRIEASGREIHVHTDSAALFRLGSRRQLPALRSVAEALAKRGISVRISVPEGTLACIGAVEVSALQKIITRSPHIKLGKASTWATVVKAQGTGRESASLMPPSTPLPISPTFQRRYRMKPTTTHYARGGGRPRLIFVRDSEKWDGLPPLEYDLTLNTTVIGSGDEADFKLPDLAAIHGKILHTDQDEYVFVPQSDHNSGSEQKILRTGARIILGPWRLVFFREEYADHGRPFGGRTAGEFARLQRPQFDPRTGQIEYDAIVGLGDSRKAK